MTDTIEPHKDDDDGILNEQNIDKISDDKDHRQGIFDELFQALMGGFGKACEEQGIEIAIAIAKHPQVTEPIVFYRGHIVDAAAAAAEVLRQIKQEVYEQLSAEPKR